MATPLFIYLKVFCFHENMSEFNSLQLNSCGPFEPPNPWTNPPLFSPIDNYAPLPPLPSSVTSSILQSPLPILHPCRCTENTNLSSTLTFTAHITSSICEESDAIQALLMRRSVVLVWLCFLLISVMSISSHGARDMQVFKEKPPCGRRNFGYFMGYLPKAMPIPPSAPSKQHNAIGLEKNATP